MLGALVAAVIDGDDDGRTGGQRGHAHRSRHQLLYYDSSRSIDQCHIEDCGLIVQKRENATTADIVSSIFEILELLRNDATFSPPLQMDGKQLRIIY